MRLTMSVSKKQFSDTCLRMVALVSLSIGLSGCDYVSHMIDSRTPEQLRDEGMALGAGCRQAGQSLEDCYKLNPKSQKSGIYAGWKEMHEYMAAMNIETAKTKEEAVLEEDPIKKLVDPNEDGQKAAVTKKSQTQNGAKATADAEEDQRRTQAQQRRERDRERAARNVQRLDASDLEQRRKDREERKKAREERAAAREAARVGGNT